MWTRVEHANARECARSITRVLSRVLNPRSRPIWEVNEFRTCKQGVDPAALACCEHRLPLPRHLDRAIMNIPGGAPKKETRVDHYSQVLAWLKPSWDGLSGFIDIGIECRKPRRRLTGHAHSTREGFYNSEGDRCLDFRVELCLPLLIRKWYDACFAMRVHLVAHG